MIFASVEREDQEPTCPYYFGAGSCKSGCWDEPRCITDMPLDGWRPRQVNQPNPILTTLRDALADGWDPEVTFVSYLDDLDDMSDITEDQDHVDHARRVLTRLAALS